MLINRTPLRITLGGGGTDLPEFYTKHGGMWLNATIDKYVYVAVKSRFEKELRLAYSKIEEVQTVQDIEHPIIREVLDYFNVCQSVELSTMADLPSGTGLGSSGAFTVGLINALANRHRNKMSLEEIAELAYRIERNNLSRTIGKQDQYSAAFGGIKMYIADRTGKITLQNIPTYDIMQHVVLIYTSKVRDSQPLLKRVSEAEDHMLKIMDYGRQSARALLNADYKELGMIMHEHWLTKQKISTDMSTPEIDKHYKRCLNYCAYGGKLVGAGGGGFLMMIVPNDEVKRDIVRASRSPFTVVPVELSLAGTEVIQW